MSSTEVMTLITQTLANMPEGANPWAVLKVALRARIQPTSPNHFRVQLYVLSALLVVVPLTLFGSLVVRFRTQSLFFFRRCPTPRGSYIVPHYLATWSALIILFLGVLQGYIWETVSFSNGVTTRDVALWKTLVWLPAWIAFWSSTVSLVCTHVLHRESSGRPLRSFWTSPALLNAATFGIPCAVAASVIVLAVASHQKYGAALDAFETINQAIDVAETTFTGSLDASLISTGLPLFGELLTNMSDFADLFRKCFICWFAWTIFLQITLTIASVAHLRELRQTMDELAARSTQSPEARAQERALQGTYLSLVNITYSIFFILTVFCGCFAYVAFCKEAVLEPVYQQAASLIAPYIFTVLGLPLSILLFNRALAQQAEQAAPDTLAATREFVESQVGTHYTKEEDTNSIMMSPLSPSSGPAGSHVSLAPFTSFVPSPATYSPPISHTPSSYAGSVGAASSYGTKTMESYSSGRALVPAAEAMEEHIPSHYIARSPVRY